jgi:hypothetical protein
VSFAAIILFVASQRVFIVVSIYFFMTQSGNFWIRHRIVHATGAGAAILYQRLAAGVGSQGVA